ncbi:hypothetical protein NY607_11960 [Lysinibacillus sp. A4]|uniref:hypothetical protein n=1 Tax=Lysinibacillus TaxID=400634 RepID=UPI001C0F859B|nr:MULTISPECIES: hypothetical protein [Lysinibacillus]MBU5253112.1 hypothetical protein [Lysinibacillus capsici]MCS5501840.1 hypothetical protein [Lysinibacillus sp. A4]
MKKVLTGFVVLLLIITASNMLHKKESNTSASVNTEKIENTLVKSMEESKTEKKLLEQFLTKSFKELKDSGYQVGLNFSHEERNLTVQVQDKALLEANKINIEKIIHTTAKKVGFQDFKVDFLTLDSYPTLSEEDEKLRKSMTKVFEEISALLKEKGYHSNSISTNPNNEIIIEIQGMKEDLEKSKEIEELKKIIGQTIHSNTDLDYTVKIRKKSKLALRDQDWQPIFDAIREETNKRFKEYRGFAYSFHPEPLQIIIKTNIHSSKWFGNSDKKINQITEYVDKIIELKIEELSIEEIPYEIIIRDKNDKEVK